MKIVSHLVLAFVVGWFLLGTAAQAGIYHVTSPDHGQTFSYGSEQHRAWAERGSDRHLVVLLDYTNDPYVDRQNPREYDNFTFTFPGITRAADGHTFLYRAPNGRLIPVADRHPSFLGNEIRLLPNAVLIIRKPHGYLTLVLEIEG